MYPPERGARGIALGLGSDEFASEFSISSEELDGRRRAVDAMRFLSRAGAAPGRAGVGGGLRRKA
jgi:hypothetical protein